MVPAYAGSVAENAGCQITLGFEHPVLQNSAAERCLILFAPHAFASQRQEGPSALPSPLVFRTISTDVFLTPCVPSASHSL